ncbi:hypothetical protein GOP47_0029185 [Adiantum capillus-veneris]|nr:hypothetical protein GOP47_0029185 [Adiantum capillus-veneris]
MHSTSLLPRALICIFIFLQAGLFFYRSDAGSDEEATCQGKSSILIEQRDLQFNHPITAFTATVECACFATDIRLVCGSEWTQALVNATDLSIGGDGICLLLPGASLAPNASHTFLYQHSPPLDIHYMDAIFSNCTSTSSSTHLIALVNYAGAIIILIHTLLLAFTVIAL